MKYLVLAGALMASSLPVLPQFMRSSVMASNPASATTYPASFAAPPAFSVAGREVSVTGIYSMAKGDFNGDGKTDIRCGCGQNAGICSNRLF